MNIVTPSIACDNNYHTDDMGALSYQRANILLAIGHHRILWYIRTVKVAAIQLNVTLGCHMTLFVAASYILSSRWRLSPPQRMLFVLIIILFIMSTVTAAIAFTKAFVVADVLVGVKGYPGETEFALHEKELSDLLDLCTDIVTDIVNVIADGLVIWRCYIICRRRLSVVVVPIVLLVTGTALGCVVFIFDVKMYKTRKGAPLSELLPPHNFIRDNYVISYLITGFWTASALINILATIFMGCQIRRVSAEHKAIHAAQNSNISLVLNLMIGSGMTSGTSDNIERIMPCIAAGISPTFLAVFLALGNSKRELNTHSAIHVDRLSDWRACR
ncbi:hypothetical protein NEOLEDRAFT_933547 [Neolentinus lepideus HHB14362 ss-1]|uniref:Uncharacterized protein n=1 Tax=Neolentinus lepideus HHB14362 ss-1 TaxID=1314782 RepID=A0A165NK42_9AGAM|nr:hypothetical protein NEOLEDRAFT_933547 [Neolentinus lepideus HHB14362 ss-1]